MAASATVRQLLQTCAKNSHFQSSPSWILPCSSLLFKTKHSRQFSTLIVSGHRDLTAVSKATAGVGGTSPAEEDDDGVSLGTMKLPLDTDLSRFEMLLFQWANSLCQGASLPLPMPLKVDKIPGGARLGFVTISDAKTEVLVYIDCLVFPATNGSTPVFRAIRNGALKDRPPPGEPRIMKSLLQALKKCAEIARV